MKNNGVLCRCVAAYVVGRGGLRCVRPPLRLLAVASFVDGLVLISGRGWTGTGSGKGAGSSSSEAIEVRSDSDSRSSQLGMVAGYLQ
jgi:hypothetical protein